MRVAEWLVLYGLVGVCVVVREAAVGGRWRPLALLLWPLWLPGLWVPSASRFETAAAAPAPALRPSLRRLVEALAAHGVEAPDLRPLAEGLEALAQRRAELERSLADPSPAAVRARLSRAAPGARPALAAQLARLDQLAERLGVLRGEEEAAEARIEELTASLWLARSLGEAPGFVEAALADLGARVAAVQEVAA